VVLGGRAHFEEYWTLTRLRMGMIKTLEGGSDAYVGPLLPEQGGNATSHDPPCSWNPHAKAVVVRRAQLRTTERRPAVGK
jgi:hypothetical protein